MDPTTPQPPAAPALLPSLRHLRRLALGGALALALLGAAAGYAGPAGAAADGDPGSIDVSSGLTRKVNEYEGQHRLAAAGDPSQWGVSGSVRIGDDPEDPKIPPGLADGKTGGITVSR